MLPIYKELERTSKINRSSLMFIVFLHDFDNKNFKKIIKLILFDFLFYLVLLGIIMVKQNL